MMLKRTILLLAIFVFSFFSGFSQKRVLHLQITYIEPYCGGARPTEEMEKQAQMPRPYIDKTIILVARSGKIRCVKTDSTGYFKIKLKAGQYRVMEEWRYYKQIPYKLSEKDLDKDCLKSEWEKELFIVNVSSNNVETVSKNKIVIHCPWAVPCLLQPGDSIPQ